MQNNYVSLRKHKKFSIECGEKFGRLTYTGHTFMKNIYNHWVRFVEAICECGEVKVYPFYRLSCGGTQSCGCFRKDEARKRRTTHGLSNHKLYDVWQKMVLRCYDKENEGYVNYGARVIS